MGIFNFFKAKNITKDWERDKNLTLNFDFTLNSLNNIKIGNNFQLLSNLGPCDNKKKLKVNDFLYLSLGLLVGTDNNQKIDTFILYWNDIFEKEFTAYAGKCFFQDKQILLSEKTTKEEFIKIFGEPYWQDIDFTGDTLYDEIILFYEFSNLEWQVEFLRDETLKLIIITNKPIMDDKECRNAYGVTKDWPPKFY